MPDQEPPQPHRDSGPEPPERCRLTDFLRQHREDILSDWEKALRARHPEQLTARALLHEHIPGFLDQLAEAAEHLGLGEPLHLPHPLTDEHAPRRLEQGYEPGELALEYGLLRTCILRRMEQSHQWVSFVELELLEESIDQCIMCAVTRYARTRERMLQALERVSRAALESHDVDTFLPRLLRVMMETSVAVDGASILLREGERLRLRAAVGLGAQQALEDKFSIPLGEGLTGQVASERRPREVRSAAQHPDLKYELIRKLGIRASYSVPLLSGDTLIGVAHMGSRTVFEFSESDKLLFRTMMTRATAFLIQVELATREREARAEAQRSLAQLNALLATAPVGIAFLDRELRYLRINETLAQVNSTPVEAHLGKTFREVVPTWVADLFEPIFLRVLETGQPVSHHQFSSRPNQDPGPQRHWLGNYYPVRAESGEVQGLGCLVVDITQPKQVEEELRREARLREQLIGVVGHDLRNPLNAINASAFQLERTEELSEKGVRAVARIRNSAARMARLIGDILDFARSNLGGGLPIHRERVNLHELCRSALEELQVAHPDRRLELEVEGDGWGCWDEDRLAQVLSNLVSNALQHGNPAKAVHVEVRDGGAEVYLHVHNEGPPIPPEVRASLFQPFRRGTSGKAATRSVGLGLYIVQQVALAHGGEVTVHSTAEDGTRFTLRLPRQGPGVPPEVERGE